MYTLHNHIYACYMPFDTVNKKCVKIILKIITLTLSQEWWGKKEGREGGEKNMWGPEPGTYHVLGKGPQLHATGVV